MTLDKVIENARSRVSRRFDRQIEQVDAVYDDELWEILESLGLLSKLDAGELTCHVTGRRLTRDNIGGLIGSPDGPLLICDSVDLTETEGAT